MKRISDIIGESLELNGFAILKPGFLSHEEDFSKLLTNRGWRIIRKKQGVLTDEQVRSLYNEHKDKDFYNDLCKYMISGPCACYSCYKSCKDPIKDMSNLKDEVRNNWGKDELHNAMHSCDNINNVSKEANICFGEGVAEGLEDFTEFDKTDTSFNIIPVLKSLYAEEIFAFYQYFCVAEFLHGMQRPSIQNKIWEFAEDELNDHAKKLLKRINELSVNEGANISDITNLFYLNEIAQHKYMVPAAPYFTNDILAQNIEAEKGAIEHYKEAIKLTDGVDPVTCDILTEILADEEEHLTELTNFLNDMII